MCLLTDWLLTKMQCSVFLMLLTVLVSPVLAIGQTFTCPIGQRWYTPGNKGPYICEDCLPGTFMNLTTHSKTKCFPCSTCPGSVGRPCNLTSDTVCCPLPNMTVVDSETGAYCMIAASQPQPGPGLNHSNGQHNSDSGKIDKTSGNGDVHVSNKDVINCAGHILTTYVFLYFIYTHLPPLLSACCKWRLPAPVCFQRRPPAPVYCKWAAVIAVAVCVPAVFTQLDNYAENICFLVCVCLTIFCITFELICEFVAHVKGRLKNAVQGTRYRVCAASNPTRCDQDDPEYQSCDPLVSDSETPGLALGCQVDLDRQQACPPPTNSSPRRSLHELITEDDRSHAASEQYVHSVAEDNHDPNDTRIHGVCPPTNHQVVPTEPIKLTSGSDDSYSAKLAPSGCSRGEVHDDETELSHDQLSHDQLALNLRSESSAPVTTFSNLS